MNRSFTAALLIALLSTTSALAQAKAWRVTEIKGAVQIETNGVRRIANGPMQIAPGDVVTTGRDGRVVLTQGQDFVLVAPNSRMRIAEPKANGLTQIFEDLGSAVFKIEKQSAPHFSVQTPYLAAVVKGTTFSVNVTNEGASVQVTEGAVQVSTLDGNATQLVTPGMIGMVSERQQQQLVVDTGGARRTEGPAQSAAAGVAAPEASPNPGDLIAGSNGGASENAPSPVAVEARIAAVAEAPVSLAQASGGLISGELTASIIPVSNARASEQAQTVLASLTNPGAGSSVIPAALAGNNGNSGNGNSGNGNGNAATETAAAGNNGNGNSGNGNGNAGAESAVAGNNGNGSGNAATGANGNSGNGNGNAGAETAVAGNNGNGNGNAATGNSGNGNSGNGNGAAATEAAAAVNNGNAGNNGNGNGNSGAGAIGVEVVVSAPGNSGAGNAGVNSNSGSNNSGNGNTGIEVVVSAPGNSGVGNAGANSGNGNANAGANSGNSGTGGIEVAVAASGSGNGNGNAGVNVGIGNAGTEASIGGSANANGNSGNGNAGIGANSGNDANSGNGNGNAGTEVASIIAEVTGQGADKGIGKK